MDITTIILAAADAVQQALPAAGDAAVAAESAHEEQAGLLGTLGINWKLFLAQLLNFGVVLFVFWKWVVSPLGKALSDRQEKIESGLKNAAYMEDEKKKFEEWKQSEMRKVRGEAEVVMMSATETSEKIRQEISASTQAQASKMIEQAKAAIANERDQAMREARQGIAELVVLASEKVIGTKLDPAKDRELVARAVKELE